MSALNVYILWLAHNHFMVRQLQHHRRNISGTASIAGFTLIVGIPQMLQLYVLR